MQVRHHHFQVMQLPGSRADSLQAVPECGAVTWLPRAGPRILQEMCVVRAVMLCSLICSPQLQWEPGLCCSEINHSLCSDECKAVHL